MAGWNGIVDCECRAPEVDDQGLVRLLQTCPACQTIRLAIIRGAQYAGAYMTCGDTVKRVLLKQLDFFSL